MRHRHDVILDLHDFCYKINICQKAPSVVIHECSNEFVLIYSAHCMIYVNQTRMQWRVKFMTIPKTAQKIQLTFIWLEIIFTGLSVNSLCFNSIELCIINGFWKSWSLVHTRQPIHLVRALITFKIANYMMVSFAWISCAMCITIHKWFIQWKPHFKFICISIYRVVECFRDWKIDSSPGREKEKQ